MDDGYAAVVVAFENQMGLRVELSRRVASLSRRYCSNNTTASRIHHSQEAVSTRYEKTAMLAVNGHRAWPLASRQRPCRANCETPRVHGHHDVFIGSNRDKDVPLFIGSGKLRSFANIQRRQDFTIAGIKGGHVLAASVESKHTLCCGIVKNTVWVI